MICIVTALHNRATLIGPCIASVLAQTAQDWQLVVVDDGSTDGSLAASTAAAKADPRITILSIPHTGNPGIVKDHGIRASTGPWIACLDSDDTLPPTALAQVEGAMTAYPVAGVIYTDRLLVRSGTTFPDRINTIPWSMTALLQRFIARQLFVFQKSLYTQVGGFDPDLKFVDDYDLALKLSEVTTVVHLAQPLYLKGISRGVATVSNTYKVA